MAGAAGEWTLEDWVSYVFDRPVAEPQWWFSLDADLHPDPAPIQAVEYMTALCQGAQQLLSSYSNEQLNQSFWYLYA